MAQGINDIANGRGFLYFTGVDGTTILQFAKNDKSGALAMRERGAINAPVAAQRSAYGIISCDTTVTASNVTAVTIGGVNQIGGNVALSNTEATSATAIAAAINAFTPGSGPDYTAQAIDALVYVYAPPSAGSTPNGLFITVSSSSGSNVFTTTDFANGSSATGDYDNVIGGRFFINADYSGTATPTSLVNAVEITGYMTVRGMEVGIVSKGITISSDRITGINRSCAFTTIALSTQGGGAGDIVAFIETAGFIEGDTLILRSANTNVPVVEDATNTTSPVSNPNIYLTNATSFALDGQVSITLQFKYDSTLGPIWVEQGRSVSGGGQAMTRSALRALRTAGGLTPQSQYLITDRGGAGLLLTATTASTLSFNGTYLDYVPDYQNTLGDFAGTWNALRPSVTVNKNYAWSGQTYKSLTGVVGTAPDTDTTNWVLVDPTVSGVFVADACIYDIDADWVGSRSDVRGNTVTASKGQWNGNSPLALFQWGNDSCTGNTVVDSMFDVINQCGACIGNMIIGDSNWSGNTYAPSANSPNLPEIKGNFLLGVSYNGNAIVRCNSNVMQGYYATDGSFNTITVNANGTSSNFFDFMIGCTFKSNVYSNTTSGSIGDGQGFNNVNNDGSFAEIQGNVFASGAVLKNVYCSGNGNVASNTLTVGMQNIHLVDFYFTGNTVSSTILDGFNACGGLGASGMTFDGGFDNNTVISALGSTLVRNIDMDNPAYYVSPAMATPYSCPIGTFTLSSVGAPNVISSLFGFIGNFPIIFKPVAGQSETCTPIAIGVAADGDIVSDTGSATYVGRTNGCDYFTVQANGTNYTRVQSVVHV